MEFVNLRERSKEKKRMNRLFGTEQFRSWMLHFEPGDGTDMHYHVSPESFLVLEGKGSVKGIKGEERIIETDKGIVRLLPVRERAAQLFGDDGASGLAQRIETAGRKGRASAQPDLFAELVAPPATPSSRGQRQGRGKRSGRVEDMETRRDATTLDRVHAAMLLQANGAANALRSLLQSEVERGPEFLRLANALSALYPTASEEKRLLDAMLLAVPR